MGLPVARGGALLTPALAAQDYEAYCIDIFFCTEMNAAEWAEQCQGLGCELSAGVDQPAFESLFLEYGRYVPAPPPPQALLRMADQARARLPASPPDLLAPLGTLSRTTRSSSRCRRFESGTAQA